MLSFYQTILLMENEQKSLEDALLEADPSKKLLINVCLYAIGNVFDRLDPITSPSVDEVLKLLVQYSNTAHEKERKELGIKLIDAADNCYRACQNTSNVDACCATLVAANAAVLISGNSITIGLKQIYDKLSQLDRGEAERMMTYAKSLLQKHAISPEILTKIKNYLEKIIPLITRELETSSVYKAIATISAFANNQIVDKRQIEEDIDELDKFLEQYYSRNREMISKYNLNIEEFNKITKTIRIIEHLLNLILDIKNKNDTSRHVFGLVDKLLGK